MIVPLISVIIPMYNAEKYIEKCLKSVCEQSFDNYEVIVVDDGSKDLSPRIADNYAREYTCLKVIHQKNGGVIKARKTGVGNASGLYILNLDSDDWLLKDHLIKIAEEINKNHPDIVVTGYIEDNEGIQKKYNQNISSGFYAGDHMQKDILGNFISTSTFFSFGIYPTLWTSCIKKELISKAQVNLPETYSIGEDISVTYPCIINAASLSILDEYTYVYRIQNESMTHVFDEKFSKKLIYLLDHLTSVIPATIVSSKQFNDYIVFETCLLVGSYLGAGVKKHPYADIVRYIEDVLAQPIIRNSVKKFNIMEKRVPLKYKIKVFLIKMKWLKVYSYLLK